MLFLALALVLAGASAGAAAPDPIDIYAVLPLTGPAAFSGVDNQHSLLALQSVVNAQGGVRGRPIRFQFLDEASDAATAVQLTNQLIAKHVQWMLGPGVVANCRATEPLVKDGPVQYCQSPAVHPAKDSYLFSSSVSSHDQVLALVRYARARGWNRIATITLTDATGQDGDAAVDGALALPENKAMTLVRREHFNGNDLSVGAQIADIKAAQPQVVFLWAPNAPFGTLLHGVHDAGLSLPMMTTNGNMTYSELKQFESIMPSELYFPGLTYAVASAAPPGDLGAPQRIFHEAMDALHYSASLQSGFLWDPGMILVQALRTLGPDATSAQVHTYIENLHGFIGIAGAYDFRGGNQRGLTADNLVVMRWDTTKNDWVPVSKLGGKT
ncbi:MAG: ABC transporter substrate-binding protein [Candidatus Lustribacter sp.]|jgi:branched-chain amino acid transport system substrate-binding protein